MVDGVFDGCTDDDRLRQVSVNMCCCATHREIRAGMREELATLR